MVVEQRNATYNRGSNSSSSYAGQSNGGMTGDAGRGLDGEGGGRTGNAGNGSNRDNGGEGTAGQSGRGNTNAGNLRLRDVYEEFGLSVND
jgi:hypothetical protein